MSYAHLSDNYSVAPQIQPEHVEFFVREGFTTFICNRPDGEDAGQPPSASIRAACEQHGVAFHMLPIQGRTIPPETVRQFLDLLNNAPGPVLGYCRSGTRSAILWQIASQTAPPP